MNKELIYLIENKSKFETLVSIAEYFVDVIEDETCSTDFAFIINSEIISKSRSLKSEIENNGTIKHLYSDRISLKNYEVVEIDSPWILFLINSSLLSNNEHFLHLLLSVVKLLNQNIISEKENCEAKLLLDSKIEQLNQLYELSKEFSGILELEYVSKLLLYTIVGQFLVNNFAILYFDDEIKVLESKTSREEIIYLISKIDYKNLLKAEFAKDNFPEIYNAGFELILPMQIKNKTKGLVLLGEKKSKESYSKHDIEYINSVGSLAIISIENAVLFKEALAKQAIERDLETARTIQKNLLPHDILQPEGYEIAAYSEAAKQVGGDYFDLLTTENKETIFAIGDVSGKGITASLLVANSQAYLKSISKQNLAIDDATGLLNDLVEESTVSGTYITFFWGRLNSKKELTYVNAGHNPPLLIRNGEIKKLESGGLILGIMKTMVPYESEYIQLQSGDYIITFTDGVTEAMNSNEEEYSDERFEQLCKTFKNQRAEEVKDLILNDVKEFTNGFEQSDDVTLLVIKVV